MSAWTPLECCTAALLRFPHPIPMSTKLETQICKFHLIKLNRTFTDLDKTLHPPRKSIPDWNPNESPIQSIPLRSSQIVQFFNWKRPQCAKRSSSSRDPGAPELQQTTRNPIDAHLRGESQNLKRGPLWMSPQSGNALSPEHFRRLSTSACAGCFLALKSKVGLSSCLIC